jgi:hypothetical protein
VNHVQKESVGHERLSEEKDRLATESQENEKAKVKSHVKVGDDNECDNYNFLSPSWKKRPYWKITLYK